MALWRANSAEGGSNGTTVTTANSAASGDAWSNVTIVSTGTLTFDNAFPADGTLAYKVVRPTNTQFAPAFRWDFADERNFYGSFYTYLTSVTWPNPLRLCIVMDSAGSRRAELNIDSTGHLRVINSANTVVATATNALPINQLVRVEFHFLGDPTVGRMETSYFLGSSPTPEQGLALETNVNTAGLAGRCEFGGSSATVADGYVFYFDALRLFPPFVPGSLRRFPIGV